MKQPVQIEKVREIGPQGNVVETLRQFIQYNFNYVAKLVSLTPGSSATVQIKIESDADFVWCSTAYACDLAGAAQTESTIPIPLVDVSIVDTGSGRALQSEPTRIDSIAGRGNLPNILSAPLVYTANSNISVTFTNNSASLTYTALSLTFLGYKKVY